VIADSEAGHARSDFHHHARAFVAQNGGEETLAVQTVQRIGVGVADPRRLDLDQHLTRARPLQIDLDDLERTFGFERNGGAGFHDAGSFGRPYRSRRGRSLLQGHEVAGYLATLLRSLRLGRNGDNRKTLLPLSNNPDPTSP